MSKTSEPKPGIEYFRMDVGFYRDRKIQFVTARFGAKGESITGRLLCEIYERHGYYMDWNKDIAQLFAKGVGYSVSPSLANDVVNELAKRGFFDKTLLNSFGILTSREIQARYFLICKNAERKGVLYDPNYILVDISKYDNVKPAIKVAQNAENSPPKRRLRRVFTTKRKVKEKESKEKETENKKDTESLENIINHHVSFSSLSQDTAKEREENAYTHDTNVMRDMYGNPLKLTMKFSDKRDTKVEVEKHVNRERMDITRLVSIYGQKIKDIKEISSVDMREESIRQFCDYVLEKYVVKNERWLPLLFKMDML